jgi:hypothetical protein
MSKEKETKKNESFDRTASHMADEYVSTKTEELTREQIVLWAYESGFPTNYVRGEVTRFETFARLLQKYLERDYK